MIDITKVRFTKLYNNNHRVRWKNKLSCALQGKGTSNLFLLVVYSFLLRKKGIKSLASKERKKISGLPGKDQ